MKLNELYLLARNNTYKTFKEEVDYRITGHLSTTVSENEFEVKLISPIVLRQSEQLKPLDSDFTKALNDLTHSKIGNKPKKSRRF